MELVKMKNNEKRLNNNILLAHSNLRIYTCVWMCASAEIGAGYENTQALALFSDYMYTYYALCAKSCT